MIKNNLHFFAIAFFLLVLPGIANASPIFIGDTEELITDSSQSQPYQDNTANVNWLVGDYNFDNNPDLPSSLVLLGKWETNDTGGGTWECDVDPEFTGDFIGDSGTWYTPSGWNANDPLYYSFKAGSQQSGGGFELYYANGDLSGSWNTAGLGSHSLSHISFWTAESQPVPEPTTMILFGIGLIGLAGARTQRKKK